MIQFVSQRWSQIMLNSWQHLSLVVQCLVLATVIALVVAAVCYRSTFLTSVANNVSAVGLTIPSFALIGLLIIPLGLRCCSGGGRGDLLRRATHFAQRRRRPHGSRSGAGGGCPRRRHEPRSHVFFGWSFHWPGRWSSPVCAFPPR